MKRFFLTVTFLTIAFANAQANKFALKAGLLSSSYDGYSLHRDKFIGNNNEFDNYYNNYGFGGYSTTTSNVGVYVGALVDFGLIDKFRLQPELNLSFAADKDLGYIALNIPVLVKYSVFNKCYAMAGPAANYAVDGDDDQFSPSFDLGASYDITENFYVEIRGDIGLSGYLGSTFNAGIGYRLYSY